MIGSYILDENHQPVLAASSMEWSQWMFDNEGANKTVGKTDCQARDVRSGQECRVDVSVSTVFLGIDHGFGRGISKWFETMIFGSNVYCDRCWRCETWEEAVSQHQMVLDLLAAELTAPPAVEKTAFSEPLEAIREFADHPSLKGLNRSAIYYLDRQFYLADTLFLFKIDIDSLIYTNMGEPYRSLARINYHTEGGDDSMNVDMESAARLAAFCAGKAMVFVDISPELRNNRQFANAWEVEIDE